MPWFMLLKANTAWWEARDDTSHPLDYALYTVDDVAKDVNPKFFSLLQKLNQYIITLDSQDGTCELISSLASPSFLQHEGLEHLAGIPSRELQRPYVDFLCDRKLIKKLLQLSDYGIACIIDEEFKYNDAFRSQFRTPIQVNLTKTVFENGVETYYTNFNSDVAEDQEDEFGPFTDYTFVTMIALDYGASGEAMLSRLLSIVH
jgi:hypothetical protein